VAKENLLIIGLGLIGRQRLDACIEFGIKPESIYVFDSNTEKASLLREVKYSGLNFVDSFESALLVSFKRAIVAVPHDAAVGMVTELLDRGCKVILEKPLGRNIEEAQHLASHKNSTNLSVGFNYRFMPGIIQLKNKLANGTLGTISSIKMELGHGGAPTDATSWKLNPVMAGGGVLLDPGIHLIDLMIHLFNIDEANFTMVGKTEWRGFWNTGIEESANLLGYLRATPFTLTSSIVAWRTRFKIEVIGTENYFEIDGRGRSDGPQTITEGPRWGWLSANSQNESETKTELMKLDKSLQEETFDWLREGQFICNIAQALTGMKIYNKVVGQNHDH